MKKKLKMDSLAITIQPVYNGYIVIANKQVHVFNDRDAVLGFMKEKLQFTEFEVDVMGGLGEDPSFKGTSVYDEEGSKSDEDADVIKELFASIAAQQTTSNSMVRQTKYAQQLASQKQCDAITTALLKEKDDLGTDEYPF